MIVQSIGFSSIGSVPSECPSYRRLRASTTSERSLASRAALLDDLVHEQDGSDEEEQVDPLAEAQDDADQPEDQRDGREDPDHGIGSSRTANASTPSTTSTMSENTRTLAASTMRLVGAVHAVLNVEPRWNVGNYSLYGEIVARALAKKMKGDKLVAKAQGTFACV